MIDQHTFRDALGRFATGVTVVSMDTGDGPRGITVNAFLSLSLEPPLVGVSIDLSAGAHDSLALAGRYGVSVLSEGQRPLSDRFAGLDVAPEFRWERLGGSPVLTDSLVQLDCSIVTAHRTGDHTLFVGEVEHATMREGSPLLYHRGRYGMDGGI
jgi:flavin reductase (DIM6/NTAB) family NADH-FMN oxidoreductase RutF